jgi:hypothetical protein
MVDDGDPDGPRDPGGDGNQRGTAQTDGLFAGTVTGAGYFKIRIAASAIYGEGQEDVEDQGQKKLVKWF